MTNLTDPRDCTDRDERVDALLIQRDVECFLYEEAEVLDARELEAWLEFLADDVQYRMPRRIMNETDVEEFSDRAAYYAEDFGSLKNRIRRFDSEYAWSERPPTRTRRLVGNVRVGSGDDRTLVVKSNLLLALDRAEGGGPDIVTAERRDRLRQTDGGFELTDREIRLDPRMWPTGNISVFL